MSENRPALKEGMTWGADISVNALTPGDVFQSPGNRYRSSIGGTITKVNRVNVLYDAPYFDRILQLKTSKSDLLSCCYVQRGSVVHRVSGSC